jgi:hypothetical protein
MKQLIKKLKKPKNKNDTASDGDAGLAFNASSAPSPATAVTPVVGTSTAALRLNQTEDRTSAPPHPSDDASISNEPTKGNRTESARQEVTAQPSILKSDTANQNVQELENEPISSEISVSNPKHPETRLVSRPLGQQLRDGAIKALDFASIISEATDLLKPVKAFTGGIKKVLEITKVRDSRSTLFTRSLTRIIN